MKICQKIKLLFNRNSPSSLPVETESNTLSNLEYENALMKVLEAANNGASWGQLQGILMGEGINKDELAVWLEDREKEWQGEGDNYEELRERLQVLGTVATGKLGEVARSLGEGLSQNETLEDNNSIDWSNQGKELFRLGKFEEAIASFDKALEINSDYYQAWYNRGVVLDKLGKFEEAIASYDKALAINPDDNPAWVNRGNALGDLGRFEEAIASYDKALEINPDYYLAWVNRGWALSYLGRSEEAIAACDKALEINPDLPEPWVNRGWVLSNLDRSEEAIAACDKALEINPDLPEPWINRSIAANQSPGYNQFIEDNFIDLFVQEINNNKKLLIKSFENPSEQLIDFINQPIADSVIQQLRQRSFNLLSRINPELNKRGYEGALNSLTAELDKAIGQETHPEGWGKLHYEIGKLHYNRSHLANSALFIRKHGGNITLKQRAKKHYNLALKTITIANNLAVLRLDVLIDLMQVHLDLGETAEAIHIRGEIRDLITRLWNDSTLSDQEKQNLPKKIASFDQLTVDVAMKNGDIEQALLLAEKGKNTCLSWLLEVDAVADTTYEAIKEKLNANTAVVYWHLSPISLTTFVMSQNGKLEYTSLDYDAENDNKNLSLQQWESWLKQWNEDYQQCRKTKSSQNAIWFQNMEEQLQQLGDILQINKLKTYLPPDINHLLLIPHRDLHRLPLHYFFDHYPCTYLPSLTLQSRKQFHDIPLQQPSDSLLLVENPKHHPDTESIYSTEIEAALIKKQFSHTTHLDDSLYRATDCNTHETSTVSSNNITTQPDNLYRATYGITRQIVMEEFIKGYHIFHFNGHGTYDPETPRHSCLFLSHGETLTAETIVEELNLNTYKLVTLAACETALTGDETITTEYVGLVSAFLMSGVSNVVSTLWTVESFVTTLFMVEFYQNLQQYPAYIALKETQNWLKNLTKQDLLDWLDEKSADLDGELCILLGQEKSRIRQQIKDPYPYQNPYYWSGFIISG